MSLRDHEQRLGNVAPLAKGKTRPSRQSRSKALLAELCADLQRIDETSILPDGDWVSVCVATWAAEWVKRLKDAGLITANTDLTGSLKPGKGPHAD